MLPGIAIFFGSFLLFMVQPMLGRTLLPAFGGTAAVWTTCLAAYQVLLLIGYFYAHLLARQSQQVKRIVHLGLLGFSLLWTVGFTFLRPMLQSHLGETSYPSLEVLLAVIVLVGLPYVLLGAGSSLIQDTVARHKGRSAYRLYAVSNCGSFLGLFFYPLVLEPFVSVSIQWWFLCVGLLGYTLLMAFLLPTKLKEVPSTPPFDQEVATPKNHKSWLWFFLPGVSCFILNSVTAHLTLDVMPLPLLWALLLGLFLLSYIVGFSSFSERFLSGFCVLALLFATGAAFSRTLSGTTLKFAINLFVSCGFCFFACTFIHSWLYTLRPDRSKLTVYYLGNAVGGAVGGSLASLVVPLLFRTVLEFPISLGIVPLLIIFFIYCCAKGVLRATGWGIAGLCFVATLYALFPVKKDRPVIYRDRGFFGTVEVLEAKARTSQGEGVIHEFVHGNTVHGIQALLPGKERMPTTYFTPEAGGYAVVGHWKYREGKPMRVNILGLGVGVMLSYARPGDFYRAYEISPEALSIAKNPSLFTFVSGCPATLELAMEDARKGLEAELKAGVEPYDVIQIDAFTGDNLPYHLSTVEAFDLYFKMLKPDGILAINISNWHMALEPYVKTLGDHFGYPMLGISTSNDYSRLAFASKFVFFCREPQKLAPPPASAQIINFHTVKAMRSVPTDDKGSFVGLITF